MATAASDSSEGLQIKVENLGKRFRSDWIIKGMTLDIPSGSRIAITGPNGSGKSTLLRMLSGYLTPTKGKVTYAIQAKPLDIENWYAHLTYAAPYVEIIEEFTLREALSFHLKLKPLLPSLSSEQLITLLRLEDAVDKEIRNFSSGMKQRLKLALAICSQGSIIILDEPTTNLDQFNADWYRNLVDQFLGNRTIIVASNVASDFSFCDQQISILDYK